MKKIALFACIFLFICTINAQKSTSPYEWDWTRDGIWTAAALGGSAGGFLLVQNKEDLTAEEFSMFNANIEQEIEDLNFLDRWAAGNNNKSANSISDIPFAISFAAPFVLLFDDETNDHTAQVLGIYLQTMATTGAMYTLTAGLVDRSRPYVYDTSGETTERRRKSGNGQRSFYSGHVAATATATFFTAKVYSDFNPDGKGKAWIWAGAAITPAAVGYFRMEAGQHFLTDVLLGYGLGAAVGYYVPELHKVEKETGLSFFPVGGRTVTGDPYNGMALQFEF